MKELLILLCRYPFDEKNSEILSKLISAVPDWNDLVRLINAHGIIALAAYNIKAAGLENEIPAESMTVLENGYRQSVVRNIWLTERWKEVNEILGNAGIKHILLKGMALEHTIYEARGLRQMNDNDILVRREEALKAWHLLQKSGFQAKIIKSPLHKNILPDIGKHLPSLFKDGYSIEIHHSLFGSEKKVTKDYIDPFNTMVEITVEDTEAFTLAKQIQLRYLISHFNRHLLEGSCQLRLYTDIILLDNTVEINIPESFIYEPDQEYKREFRKIAYKNALKSIPEKYRFQYLTGDIFPSVRWMKERYGCGWLKAVMYYPHRLGKLWWLV